MLNAPVRLIVMICLGLFLLTAFPAEAQSTWNTLGREPEPRNMTDIKIWLIIAFSAVGFGLGWFLSPSARPYRLYAGGALAILLFILAIAYDGATGWGSAILLALAGFSCGLGFWLRRTLGDVPTTFGSSRWAKNTDLENNNVYGVEGIRIGKFFDGQEFQPISYKGDRHLLTVAPTRSGKGTTQIIPNLLTYEGSMLVIDPKGENALITAQQRRDMGQDVHIVDPWGIASVPGVKSSKFNPLDWLDIMDVDVTENAMLLADALVIEGKNDKAFFIEEAKALLQGLIMYVATADEEAVDRSLRRVRKHLVSNADEQYKLWQNMAQSGHYIISSTGNRCLQKDPELMSNVMASAQAQTHFLDSARIQENTESSDFRFEDLKSKRMTIYLVLPSDRLNAFGRWMRLLVQQAITLNARNIDIQPEKPVLFLLDEFASLGRLTMVEQAYGLMAGFGMQLWGIVQDFNQLERIYDKGWQSFVANAGMIN